MKLHLLAKHGCIRRIAPVGLIVLALLRVAPASGGAQAVRTSAPAANAVVLYDAALGTTPGQQGWFYQSSGASETFANRATTLDTTADTSIKSGYFASQTGFLGSSAPVPVLDRAGGYTLTFAAQVQQEDHAGSDKNGDQIGDRAGLSLIVLSSDKKGVELGLWKDQIWIQNDGDSEPPTGTLFTHGESAIFDTTTGLISYTLSIKGASYSLSSGGIAILTGSVRDYTAWEAPPLAPANPYRTPNLIVLSDDTTSASAKIRLAYVAVTLPNYVYLPMLRR
jgi:hypothetical protein